MSEWLQLADDAYRSSTTYFDSAYRKKFEDALAHFQGRHQADSKYHMESYKYRSKMFRPKTRSMVRKAEAAAAAAFFSNVDVVSVEPNNDQDPAQKMSAELMGELINFRLNRSIPWFITCIGALQEAKVYGVVCSYQYWMYKSEQIEQPMVDMMGQPMMDETGEPIMQAVEKVIEDKPCIELLPIENVRFDPGADWTNPVKTSPYFIRKIPMYVQDVQARMDENNAKTGQQAWKRLDDREIRTAIAEYDAMRNAREYQKPDPFTEEKPLGAFEIVWVHENFIRRDGEEVVYFTLGTLHMLTDPVPLKEAYFHGERPFVIGTAAIEAHRVVPAGDVEMGSSLQSELNENANQRLDNVKLVLNKRWLIQRNKNVDLQSLNRNVPGGVTLTDDIAAIQEVNWPDVTGSAYQEQDRLNLDFDDLLGNFSQSSVMSNRKLNETVGGMQMLGSGANQVQEYSLRTFVETWVEPVLYQLVKLEQQYETDLAMLAVAGQKAQLAQKYGIDQVTDQLLDQEMTIRVNVGMGATDPNQKLHKLGMALDMYGRFMQIPGADPEELKKTIFGYSGIRSAMGAFKPADQAPPIPPQLQAQMQQMQEALQKMGAENQQLKSGLQAKQMDAQVKARDTDVNAQVKVMEADKQAQADAAKAQLEAEVAIREKEIEAETRRYEADRQAQAQVTAAQIAKAPSEPVARSESTPAAPPVQIIMDKSGAGEAGGISEAIQANAQAMQQLAGLIAQAMQANAQAIEKLAAPKTVRIQAPSGGVYEGVAG